MHFHFVLFFLPLTYAFSLTGVWDILVDSVSYIADNVMNTRDRKAPEDAALNISQLVTKYNYTFEEHTVFTKDGYIIEIHRIPNGRKTERNNLTVLLMHGILDSSDSWVLLGPDNALAYVLADSGFDVWMGNSRGNKYGLRHVNLKPDEADFWEFTWEEIGLYDLPATIDYILNVTNRDDLYYIGYSQGTTIFYVMTSTKTEYNRKVKLMFSLAPEAWMGNIKSPIVKVFSPANSIFGYFLSNFNVMTSSSDFFYKLPSIICTISCDNFLYGIFGSDSKINRTILPVILGHMPTGTSTLQFVHYGQLVQSGGFHRFDFGPEGNIQKYGSVLPPVYNLSNIEVPIVIFYSENESFSDVKDVEILSNKLPTVYESVNVSDFNHLDYLYSIESIVVYRKIISFIERLESLSMVDSTKKSTLNETKHTNNKV